MTSPELKDETTGRSAGGLKVYDPSRSIDENLQDVIQLVDEARIKFRTPEAESVKEALDRLRWARSKLGLVFGHVRGSDL